MLVLRTANEQVKKAGVGVKFRGEKSTLFVGGRRDEDELLVGTPAFLQHSGLSAGYC